MSAKYVIGIDLGTTNSVLCYAPLDGDEPRLELLPIPQLAAAATVETRSTLPSFLYLAAGHEAGGQGLDLPWTEGRDFAVGEFARRQAAEVPDRTVAAAKSWLCHSRVDRRQPILPWNAPAGVPKISPVTAAQRYLEHLVAAWEAAHPEAPIAQQQVVLTVPASFDAVARDLTREAALAAGLPVDMLLLEEPQAAVYAWLAASGDRWRSALSVGDTLLVCDVGGGTTDLTLVGAAQEQGELVLQRIAVGNHLLVGGDNMDLALAHYVAGRFAEQGVELDPWQSVALWHSCRTAKETLLDPDRARIASGFHPGPGSKANRRHRFGDGRPPRSRPTADRRLLSALPADRPTVAPAGLGFPRDRAAVRGRHGSYPALGRVSPGSRPRLRRSRCVPPTCCSTAACSRPRGCRKRLLEVLAEWFGDKAAPRLLQGEHDLDHSVARGAAYYGWSKHCGGVRIRGGTARAYYVGIETAGLAVPGAMRPLKALCVAPMGMEEGTENDVPSDEIGLVVGEPAHFRFFSSSVRKADHPGDLLSTWTADELQETDSLEALLPADESLNEGYVPVRFHARLTELGVLELWCVGAVSDKRWKLEFSVREGN